MLFSIIHSFPFSGCLLSSPLCSRTIHHFRIPHTHMRKSECCCSPYLSLFCLPHLSTLHTQTQFSYIKTHKRALSLVNIHLQCIRSSVIFLSVFLHVSFRGSLIVSPKVYVTICHVFPFTNIHKRIHTAHTHTHLHTNHTTDHSKYYYTHVQNITLSLTKPLCLMDVHPSPLSQTEYL